MNPQRLENNLNVSEIYKEKMLKVFTWVLVPMYALRSIESFLSNHVTVAMLQLTLGIYLAASIILAKKIHNYRLLQSISTLVLLSGEAIICYLLDLHFSRFFFQIPIAIIYSCFMSGLLFGTSVALLSTAEALALVYVQTRGGSPVPLATNEYFLYIAVSHLLIIVLLLLFQDVLDKAETENRSRRLLRAEMMHRSALSEALGKIAHELNNPLAILDAAFKRFKVLVANPRSTPQDIQQVSIFIRDAELRIHNILKNLGIFAEGDLLEPVQETPVEMIVQDLLTQSNVLLESHRARLLIERWRFNMRLRGRPRQIIYVLSVFLENALEAMSSETKRVLLRITEQGDAIRFELEDTGHGVSNDVVDSLFEPFASTKPTSQSRGMNLSICRGLVEGQGGKIGYQRQNTGSTFWISLPSTRTASSDEGFDV